MEVADHGDLLLEAGDEGLGEHGEAVFAALPLSDVDEGLGEVDIFDTQGGTFGEAEAGAVEDAGHEEVGAMEEGEDLADLGGGEDDGEAFGVDSVGDGADIAEFALEYMAIEKDDGIEGLVLGRGGDLKVFGEVSEEALDVEGGEGRRVLGVIIEDEAFDPVGVGLDGTGAEVTEGGSGAELVEEFGGRHCSTSPLWPFAVKSAPEAPKASPAGSFKW